MFRLLPDLIIFSSMGRLGNRLQTAAYSLAYAAETKQEVWLLCLDGYEDLFCGSNCNVTCRHPEPAACGLNILLLRKVVKYLVWRLISLCVRFPRLRSFLRIQILTGTKQVPVILDHMLDEKSDAFRTTIVRGFYIYCDPKILLNQKEVVDGYFRPTGDVWQKALQHVNTMKVDYDVVVGVHIRHGDYVDYRFGEHFYTFEEYAGFLTNLARNEADLKIGFILCSDADLSQLELEDISWCAGPGDLIGDMYTLAACDYVIGPFSSYNLWSAFWGNVKRLELKRDMGDISFRSFSRPTKLTYMGAK